MYFTLYFSWNGVEMILFSLLLLNGFLYQIRMMMMMMMNGDECGAIKQKSSEKTCPSVALSTTNHT
jgi:hypothetical protein